MGCELSWCALLSVRGALAAFVMRSLRVFSSACVARSLSLPPSLPPSGWALSFQACAALLRARGCAGRGASLSMPRKVDWTPFLVRAFVGSARFLEAGSWRGSIFCERGERSSVWCGAVPCSGAVPCGLGEVLFDLCRVLGCFLWARYPCNNHLLEPEPLLDLRRKSLGLGESQVDLYESIAGSLSLRYPIP